MRLKRAGDLFLLFFIFATATGYWERIFGENKQNQ
jgi:hypothetical protein